RIRLQFEGADRLSLNRRGDLIVHSQNATLKIVRPKSYQVKGGTKRALPSRFVRVGANEIAFAVAPYDRNLPLVIDPVLIYSTYLGGSSDDQGNAITVDAAGNAYITGQTTSLQFPLTNPLQPVKGDFSDVFVSKLNPAGSALVYSTFLGGNGSD